MASPYTPERRPLPVDVHDDQQVRAWLANLVAEQIITRGQPIPALLLLRDDHVEIVDLTRMLASDPGADLAATWAAVGARTDLDRRIVVLRIDDDDTTPSACMVEETWEDGVPVAWWLGHRRYVVRDGLGELLDGGWSQHAGEGRPPEPFVTLLTPAPGARAARLLPARPPEPKVWMQTDELPAHLRAPATAMEMAELAQGAVLGALESEGLRHVLVLLIRGRTWEKWLLGEVPTDTDDMVRWLCGRAGQADGVAIVEALLAEVDGKRERLLRIVGELGGQRAERAIILAPKPGKPEDVVPVRGMARDLGPVPDGEGWIGVAPLLGAELTLQMRGFADPE